MSTPSHRVYYALWPDAHARAQLAAAAAPLAASSGGRAVGAEQLHLTLAFVGAVAPSMVGVLARLGAALAWPVVTLRFGACEWWAASRALVLTAAAPPAALLAAREALVAALAARGLATDPRAFCAHVTIARDVRRAPPPSTVGFEWTARQVALVESEPLPGASRYRPLAHWAAHDAAAGFQVI